MLRGLLAILICGCINTSEKPRDDTDIVDTDTDIDDTDEPAVDCAAISPDPAEVETWYDHSNPSLTDDLDELLPTATPASEEFDETLLEEAIAEYAALPYTWSLLVLRHGNLIVERYYHGADAATSNAVHSSSKSILSLLTGLAIEQGHLEGLDQPVAHILPEVFKGLEAEKQNITVRHLLTMTSGIRWSEDSTEYKIEDEENWLRAYLERSLDEPPGTYFEYSTGSTHLLGAAVAEATGTDLCTYAHQNILVPLQAEAERWQRDKQGYYSGGYGVYLTPRELARFGQMVANGGLWQGTQVVPSSFVEAAVSWHEDTGGRWGYGYLFWIWRPNKEDLSSAVAWGYGGQLVYIVAAHDLVVVTTTNTRDQDPDFDGMDLVRGIVAALPPGSAK
ncbi:MAG: serine hydrolase [Proteobacteria bacterium]|nr:serine hydrolase [Pseudomonadota bacterium]